MTDREKVIKELHDARRYLEDKEWSDRGASPHIDAINDALALLKEQEAKKPIYNEEKYGDYLPHCSSCEKVLPNSSQYGKAKFCYKCGQAVKWNE